MLVQVVKASNGYIVQKNPGPNQAVQSDCIAVVSDAEPNKASALGEAIIKILNEPPKV